MQHWYEWRVFLPHQLVHRTRLPVLLLLAIPQIPQINLSTENLVNESPTGTLAEQTQNCIATKFQLTSTERFEGGVC